MWDQFLRAPIFTFIVDFLIKYLNQFKFLNYSSIIKQVWELLWVFQPNSETFDTDLKVDLSKWRHENWFLIKLLLTTLYSLMSNLYCKYSTESILYTFSLQNIYVSKGKTDFIIGVRLEWLKLSWINRLMKIPLLERSTFLSPILEMKIRVLHDYCTLHNIVLLCFEFQVLLFSLIAMKSLLNFFELVKSFKKSCVLIK